MPNKYHNDQVCSEHYGEAKKKMDKKMSKKMDTKKDMKKEMKMMEDK